MNKLLQYCHQRQDELILLLRRLVELESPTGDQSRLDRCAAFIAQELERRAAGVTLHRQSLIGSHIEARWAVPGQAKPILLLGHYDTVWESGTLARRPFQEQGERICGPGVFDMKGGIALMMLAIDALVATHGALPRPLIILLNSDEETGSESSRSLIESIARECAAVLVLEPAQGIALKTARKGVGDFTLKVAGVAAHAGLDFTRGHNAILELARQIEKASAFTDLHRGLTVSVGAVRGGSGAVNVVPAEAEAVFDVRIQRLEDKAQIERMFHNLSSVDPDCRLEVSGGINRPPLERTPAVAALYEKARRLASELGFELPEASVGGGSDGNFTNALGVPTLDGLGAVGEGAHAEHECVLVEWLPKRAALLAGLIESGDL